MVTLGWKALLDWEDVFWHFVYSNDFQSVTRTDLFSRLQRASNKIVDTDIQNCTWLLYNTPLSYYMFPLTVTTMQNLTKLINRLRWVLFGTPMNHFEHRLDAYDTTSRGYQWYKIGTLRFSEPCYELSRIWFNQRIELVKLYLELFRNTLQRLLDESVVVLWFIS